MKKEKRSTTNLSKDEFIKSNTRKFLLFLDLIIFSIVFLTILFSYILYDYTSMQNFQLIIIVFIFTIISNFALKKFLHIILTCDFDRILNVNMVNEFLSSETYTEVIPLYRGYEHSYFLVSLIGMAKFYAIIKNESEISIYVQFNIEKEHRFLEDLPKEKFYIRYKIK